MSTDVVEVVARFGDTILEVVIADRYVVGDGAGANLPIAGVAPVIVDGFTVTHDGMVHHLVTDEPLRVELGAISIVATRTRPVLAMARPRIELRPYAYLATSLALHFALWAAATTTGHDDDIVKPGARRAHLVANHTSAALATRDRTEAPRLPTDKPTTDEADRDPSKSSLPLQVPRIGDTKMMLVDDDVDSPDRPDRTEEKVAAAKDTDPCSGRDCGIIKTGPYTTAPSKHGSGANFDLAPRRPVDVSVVGCRVGEGCKTAAGTDQADLRAAVETHLEAVMSCFSRGGTKAVIDFQIDPRGGFERAPPAPDEDAAAGCIADILATVSFPRPPDGEPRKVTLAFARD